VQGKFIYFYYVESVLWLQFSLEIVLFSLFSSTVSFVLVQPISLLLFIHIVVSVVDVSKCEAGSNKTFCGFGSIDCMVQLRLALLSVFRDCNI